MHFSLRIVTTVSTCFIPKLDVLTKIDYCEHNSFKEGSFTNKSHNKSQNILLYSFSFSSALGSWDSGGQRRAQLGLLPRTSQCHQYAQVEPQAHSLPSYLTQEVSAYAEGWGWHGKGRPQPQEDQGASGSQGR